MRIREMVRRAERTKRLRLIWQRFVGKVVIGLSRELFAQVMRVKGVESTKELFIKVIEKEARKKNQVWRKKVGEIIDELSEDVCRQWALIVDGDLNRKTKPVRGSRTVWLWNKQKDKDENVQQIERNVKLKRSHDWLVKVRKKRKCGCVAIDLKELLNFVEENGTQILMDGGLIFLKKVIVGELQLIIFPKLIQSVDHSGYRS
jgi:hypothetical protein